MNWENLKTNHCPYCSHDLEEVGETSMFICTNCYFNISAMKKESIERHRCHPERRIMRLRWQNLHSERCPACGNLLTYGIGPFDILACTTPECAFKINHDRLVQILEDPNHPCNQFKERERIKIYGTDTDE